MIVEVLRVDVLGVTVGLAVEEAEARVERDEALDLGLLHAATNWNRRH